MWWRVYCVACDLFYQASRFNTNKYMSNLCVFFVLLLRFDGWECIERFCNYKMQTKNVPLPPVFKKEKDDVFSEIYVRELLRRVVCTLLLV